jgi:hypothetical protein
MKIYIGHSSSFNYQDNLYNPLRNSDLNEKHAIVLPHEDSEEPFNSKDYLKNRCDVFVAEVSEASTGLGIELGWADQYEIPILCIHRESSKPSSSISQVT